MDVCRIVAQYRDQYRITTSSGERNAVLAGRLRHQARRALDLPAVGDFVDVRRVAIGVDVLALSALSGEGLDALRPYADRRRSSGVVSQAVAGAAL